MLEAAIGGAILAAASVVVMYLGRYKSFRVLVRAALVVVAAVIVLTIIWLLFNVDNL